MQDLTPLTTTAMAIAIALAIAVSPSYVVLTLVWPDESPNCYVHNKVPTVSLRVSSLLS